VDLGEEGLSFFAIGPVGAVVNRFVPLEIIVRFSEASLADGPAADGGVVTCFLEQAGNEFDMRWQMDFLLTTEDTESTEVTLFTLTDSNSL
jgi:hypothetical protein